MLATLRLSFYSKLKTMSAFMFLYSRCFFLGFTFYNPVQEECVNTMSLSVHITNALTTMVYTYIHSCRISQAIITTDILMFNIKYFRFFRALGRALKELNHTNVRWLTSSCLLNRLPNSFVWVICLFFLIGRNRNIICIYALFWSPW